MAYLAQLESICDALSAERTPDRWTPMERSDQLAIAKGKLTFPEFPGTAHYLFMNEVVDMSVDPHDPRARYTYRLIVNRMKQWSYERHDLHPPAPVDHRHDFRYPREHPEHFAGSRTVTLSEVIPEAKRYLVMLQTSSPLFWQQWPAVAPPHR